MHSIFTLNMNSTPRVAHLPGPCPGKYCPCVAKGSGVRRSVTIRHCDSRFTTWENSNAYPRKTEAARAAASSRGRGNNFHLPRLSEVIRTHQGNDSGVCPYGTSQLFGVYRGSNRIL